MASFRYGLKPLPNGTVQIRATMQAPDFNNGNPIYKATGYTIPPNKKGAGYKFWDESDYRVRLLDNMHEINKLLADWQARWESYILQCKTHKQKVDIYAFRASLAANSPLEVVPTQHKDITLLALANEYYNYISKTHKPGTTKQYKTCIEDISTYQSKYGAVRLEDVNTDFYRRYGLHLIEYAKNFNNTVNRKISRIVTLLNYATDPVRAYTNSVAYKTKFRFKSSEAARFPLLPAEIDAIKKAKISDPVKLLYLDAFRFACETTLRFSDVVQLLPEHCTVRNIKGQDVHILDLTQIKTTHENSIALSNYALIVWKRNAINKKQRVFPINSSTVAGRYLRDMFEKTLKLNRSVEIVRTQGNNVFREMVPLHKAISFHMARNTAITFQLSHLSPATVMQNAGMKKLDTVLRYYRDDQDRRMLETLNIQNNKPRKK